MSIRPPLKDHLGFLWALKDLPEAGIGLWRVCQGLCQAFFNQGQIRSDIQEAESTLLKAGSSYLGVGQAGSGLPEIGSGLPKAG